MQQRSANHARMIDVSSYQTIVDAKKVAESGISAAYVKATEGATGRDARFYTNYIGLRKVGIAVGAYCFARPATSSPIAEANALVDRVLAAGGFDLDPMLDLEDAGGLSPSALATFVLTFEAQIKKRIGRSIILYTYTSFINEHLRTVVGRINHLRLWLADYGRTVPDVPGWNTWTILQYSQSGSIPGIVGHVDLDEFNGPVATLRIVLDTSRENTSTGVTKLTPEQVKQLQTNLVAVLKLRVDPKKWCDGILGPSTAAAIKSFQYLNKIPQTGNADSATIATLNRAVAALNAPKPKPTPTPAPTPTKPTQPDNGGTSAPVATHPTAPTAPTTSKIVQAAELIQQGLDILKSL